MRNSLPYSIILGCLSFALTVPAYAVKKSLNYSTLPTEIQEEISKRFPHIQNEKINPEQVDEVLRYLQIKPEFHRLRVLDEGNGSPYILDFEYTRRVSEVTFSGNKNLSNNQVDSLFATKAGSVFDQDSLVESGERLRQAYRDRGFLNASIDIEMPPLSPSTVGVNVKITEGRQSRIQHIAIASPNTELNKKLVKELKGYLNDPYTETNIAKLQAEARKYLTENRYVRADISAPASDFNSDESEVTLTFKLDKVEQYVFEYEGVKILGIRGIQNALDLDNFYTANPSVGNELAQKIRAYYLNNGYARAEVKVSENEGRAPFQRRVRFDIEEGARVQIQKINITGKTSKEEKYYTKFIQEHSSRLIKSGYYNKEDLDTGLKNLVLELQNNGYLQAKILSTRTQYNKERDALQVFVNLDEGPLTIIESVEFSGNSSFTADELLKVTGFRAGPLRLGQMDDAIARLKTFYHERGYIEMLLLNEKQDLVTYNEANTQALLHFKIFEGPQVRVASIILEGNTFTKDRVILKELEFTNSDLLTPSITNESIARLQRTGFFSSVEISTLEAKTNVENRTVLVKVTERDPGLLNVGLGATNERQLTLRGYAGISYRNLLGTGRGASLRLEGNYNVADIKYLESRVVFGYLEPYIFNTRIRGRVNVTRSSTVTDYDIRQVSNVNSTTYSLEKDFTSHILGIWDIWSLANVRDFGLDSRYPFPEKVQDIATMGPTLDFDFRDNPFVPTKGHFTRFNAEYGSPELGSSPSIEYWRATLSFTNYTTLGHISNLPVVWANQVRGGYLRNLHNGTAAGDGIPWDKKGFTLGGQSTIRGYEAGTQEVFPNRNDLGLQTNESTYYLKSDSSMYLIKSELRFPIWESLGGAIFYDGGSVTIQDIKFADNYRDSAGFGIRYNTPVGPLSLEWAWKLDARPEEDPWRFHLSIGTF